MKQLTQLILGILFIGGAQAVGQLRVVDFDTSPVGSISAGDEITNQYSAWGVNFQYVQSSTSKSGLELWAFDSGANQNGIDDDLETPGDGTVGTGNTSSDWANNNYIFGDSGGADNILIIQEKNNTTNPDDDARGGIMNIIFDSEVVFNDIGILDIDDKSDSSPNSYIRFFDALDTQLGSNYQISELGNNSYQEVNFDRINVSRIEIDLGGSGGITGFQFTEVPEPSTYGVIGAFFLVSLVYFRRKRMAI